MSTGIKTEEKIIPFGTKVVDSHGCIWFLGEHFQNLIWIRVKDGKGTRNEVLTAALDSYRGEALTRIADNGVKGEVWV